MRYFYSLVSIYISIDAIFATNYDTFSKTSPMYIHETRSKINLHINFRIQSVTIKGAEIERIKSY